MRHFIGLGMATALCAAAAHAAPAASPEHDARWLNNQTVFLIELDRQDGWKSTASGLRYRKVKGTGSGTRPSPADTVTIHYTGRLIDGSEFDSSVARGEPATFPLPGLIKGWQEGVPLMSLGDTYEFAVPQQLAYGARGGGPIPGGATLLFTVELLGIGEPATGQ
ncbi:FKBP-type peptidyl-prolyl cis-trans isomerase [Croceibacterium soli]|nr:FKBP-type peptidyl-prolyl cis-trans isomerase [Croceibacterium soli]